MKVHDMDGCLKFNFFAAGLYVLPEQDTTIFPYNKLVYTHSCTICQHSSRQQSYAYCCVLALHGTA